MSRALDTAKSQQNNSGPTPPLIAGKNFIINGGMDIWQRGDSFAVGLDFTYGPDRYYFNRGGALTVTKRSIGSYNPPSGFQSYAELSNATASNAFVQISQTIETLNSRIMVGKVVTLSFYARANADTAKSKSLTYGITGNNATADTKWNVIPAGLSATSAITYGTGASDWTRITLTALIPSDLATVGFTAYQAPAGGLAVGDGFQITGLQIEIGSTATPFSRAGGTIQGELAACQRYYQTSFDLGQTPAHNASYFGETTLSCVNGGFSTNSYGAILFPVKMRTAPTVNIWNPRNASATGNSAKFYSAGVAYDTSTIDMGNTTSSSHGMTFKSNNMGATAIVFFAYSASAEL